MRASIAIFALATACHSTSDPPFICSAISLMPPFPRGSDSVGLVGQPMTVEVVLPLNCDTGLALSAYATIVDPDNSPVMVDPGPRDVAPNNNGLRSHVDFTPTRPGPYHVTVRVEPNVGIGQVDVLVASDRRAARPTFVFTTSSPLIDCTHVEVTPASNVLCLSPAIATYSSTDGTQLQTLLGERSAHADGVLWTLWLGKVSRWVETLIDGGAQFVREPDISVSVPMSEVALAPTRTELVGTDSSGRTFRVALSEAGLGVSEAPQFGIPTRGGSGGGPGGFYTAVWRDEEKLLAVGYGGFYEQTLDGGRGANGPISGQPVAVDSDGVWLANGFVTSSGTILAAIDLVRFGVHDGARGSHPLSFLWPTSTPLQWNTTLVATETGAVYVPVYDGGVTLQAWPADTPVVNATPDWLVCRLGSTVKIYRR